MPDISEPDPDDDVIAGAKRACAALYLEVDSSVADDLKARVYAVCERLATAEAERDRLGAEVDELKRIRATLIYRLDSAEAESSRLAATLAERDATIARVEALLLSWQAQGAHQGRYGAIAEVRAALADPEEPQ